jgi:hypothetical protein
MMDLRRWLQAPNYCVCTTKRCIKWVRGCWNMLCLVEYAETRTYMLLPSRWLLIAKFYPLLGDRVLSLPCDYAPSQRQNPRL